MIHLIMISRNKHFLNSLSFPLKIPLPRLYTESQIIHEEKKERSYFHFKTEIAELSFTPVCR